MNMTSDETMKALNRIVFQNLDLGNVLKELSSCPNQEVSWLPPSASCVIEVLDKLMKSIDEYKNNDCIYLYDENQSIKVETIICGIAKTGLSLRKDVASAICSKYQRKLPLEVYYLLHKHHVLYMEDYFLRILDLNDQAALTSFSRAINKLFLSPDLSRPNTKRMGSSVMSFLVEININESGVKPTIRKAASALLDSIIQDVIITSANNTSIKQGKRLNLLTCAMNIPGTNLKKLSPLAEYILSAILNSPLIEKCTIHETIQSHHLWLFKQNSMFFNEVLHKILVILNLKRMIETLGSLLQNGDLNWKCVLAITSLLVYTHSDGAKLIYELLENNLKESFARSDDKKLIRCFIVARHVALENTPASLTYEQWFHKYFGEGATTFVNTPKIFTFLMACMTEMVPYEQAQFLKVHLLKPPRVAPQCRHVLNQYIVLAKTRLQDLKEPFENMGIFKSVTSRHVAEEPALIDVKTALESYETTSKIPSSVIEASILKKSYFNNRFLKILLEPRELPNVPDTKVKFIDELKMAGKISQSDYDKYLNDCSLAVAKYYTGLEGDIDMAVDEDTIDPENEIKKALECFILANTEEDGDFFTLVTNISTKLATYLEQVPQITTLKKSCYSYADLSQEYPRMSHLIEQLIECFCSIRQYFEEFPSRLANTSAGVSWEQLYVSMLSWHEMLELPLLSYIWTNFSTNQSDTSRMKSLSLLVHKVGQLYDIRVSESEDLLEDQTRFTCALFDHLKISTLEQRQNFLKMSADYLENCLNEEFNILNEKPILTKFYYVYTCERKTLAKDMDSVSNIYNSDQFQNVLKKVNFSFKEFIVFECNNATDDSNPEDRLERIRCLFSSCKIDVNEGMSVLFNVLLNEKRPVFFPLSSFLQELSNQLQPMCEEIPWLQAEFYNSFKSKDTKQDQLKKYFALACGLSPHLFFVNDTNENVTQTSMVNAKDLVEEYLKPYLVESGFLSRKLTLYFYLAIIRRRNSEVVLKFFNEHCPIIIASVIHHWPVSPIPFSDPENQYVGSFFKEIEAIYDNGRNATLLPNEFIGLILYKSGLRNIFKCVENKQFSSKIFQSAIEFMVIDHGLQSTTFQPVVKWPEDTMKLISSNPAILNFCKEEIASDSLIAKIFSESIVLVYPLILATLMLELHESGLTESNSINFQILTLRTLLLNFSSCNKLYDGNKISPMAEHIVSLADVTKRTVKLLEKIPFILLNALPEDLIKKCIAPVKFTILQRIKNE